MTTIAYKAGLMACDSCWSSHDSIQQTSETKIAVLPSGGLLAQAGDNDSRCVVDLFARVKQERDLPSREQLAALRMEFGGIFVLPTGKAFLVDIDPKGDNHYAGQLWPANRGFVAYGSGADVALGAMAAGKSAREAVIIACTLDGTSKLPVHVARLQPLVNPRRASSPKRKR
jgi:hypothetical protein